MCNIDSSNYTLVIGPGSPGRKRDKGDKGWLIVEHESFRRAYKNEVKTIPYRIKTFKTTVNVSI